MPEKDGTFRELNESMIEWVCQLEDEGLSKIQYRLTDYEKDVPVMDFTTAIKAEKAIRHYTSKKFYGKPISECD